MKIAITGASGHVGVNLCPVLLKAGYQLRLLIHRSKKGLEGLNADFIQGDIGDPEAITELLTGSDIVIHLAAKIAIDRDRDGKLAHVNDRGTALVAEKAQQLGLKRMIHFSTIHAYNQHPLDEPLDETRDLVGALGTDYDLTKMAGESAVMEAYQQGLDVVILTPTSILGPNDMYPSLLGQAIIDINNGKMPALVPGGFDYVDVRDIARATLLAIEKGKSGEKYLIAGEYHTVKDLAKTIGEVRKVKVTQNVLSPVLLRILMPFFQLQSRLNGKPPLFTKESLKTLMEANPNISTRKAEQDLGYQKTPFRKTIQDTLDWFDQAGHLTR